MLSQLGRNRLPPENSITGKCIFNDLLWENEKEQRPQTSGCISETVEKQTFQGKLLCVPFFKLIKNFVLSSQVEKHFSIFLK